MAVTERNLIQLNIINAQSLECMNMQYEVFVKTSDLAMITTCLT